MKLYLLPDSLTDQAGGDLWQVELPPQEGGTSCDVVVLAEDTQVKTPCPRPVVINLSSSSGRDLPEWYHVWRRVAVLRPVQHALSHGPG